MKPFLLAALAALLLPLAALADATDTQTVVARGIGTTVAEAKKEAGRAAIEQVVGQLVDAETLVENDELVKDRILTYSGAYLENLEIVGKPVRRKSTGLVEVTVKAAVRKTQLAEKLRTENVTTAKVEGKKLFAQATSKAREAGDAVAMAEQVFENVPQRFSKVELLTGADGSPAIEADATGNVVAKIRVSIDTAAYGSWAKQAMAVFDRIADARADVPVAIKSIDFESGRRIRELEKPTYPKFDDSADRGTGRGASLLVGIPHPFRPTANALTYRFYFFAGGEKADRIQAVIKARCFDRTFVSGSLLANGETVGSSRKGLSELKTIDWTWREMSRGGLCVRSLYGRSNDREWTIVPSIIAWGQWIGEFRPTLDFFFPLGRFDPSDLEDATDLRLSLEFE